MRARRGRRAVALLAGAALAAACGSGESILTAGNDPAPATTAAPTAPPVTLAPGETLPAGATTVPAPTTAPPTTAPRPLDQLPPCDVDALDGADGPVEVLFWHGMSNELGRELERITEAYNASQDRVRVQLEFQGGYEQTIDKYLQSDTSNRPALVQLPEYAVQVMIDTASTVPVQACVEDAGFSTDEIVPSALAAYATEGVQWAMPFNVSNPVLYYNKQIYRAAGLDPESPPLTLAEVAEHGRAIRDSGAAAYGIALDSAPDSGGGWFLEQWLAKEGQFYSDNENGRIAPSTQVLFDEPTAVALAAELQAVVRDGAGVYVGENPTGQDNLLKLADQQEPATMTIGTSSALGPVLQFVEGGIIPGITSADIGVGPMPSPGGQPGALIGGAALWFVAGKPDATTAAAWDYVTYLTSAEVQSQWAAATGYVPINAGALEVDPIATLYETDPRFRVAYDQMAQAADEPTFRGPVLGPQREVRVIAAGAMGAILGGADPQQALTDAAALADALLADYNARR